MDLQEITDLIQIRQYAANTVNNSLVDRSVVNLMNDITMLLDKKIIDLLGSPGFKEYINYDNVKDVKANAIKLSNIKSSIGKL